MIEDTLSNMLKKYVSIFINEYHKYLSKEQLETLKNINYEKIISLESLDVPFGLVYYGKIHLSNTTDELIKGLQKMNNYNSSRYLLNNKDISSYLKYMCDNGYSVLEYFGDILMYFVFQLVIKNNNSFINGLINQEVKFLSIKYAIRSANLFAKEELVISKITPLVQIENLRKILFMDKPSSFKYLNEHLGFRYAKLIEEISILMDSKYKNIHENDYLGVGGLLNYANDYDNISYGDVYNYLLDFEVENKINI